MIKKDKPQPIPESAPMVLHGATLNDDCCTAITMAVFREEDLAALYRRHTGGLCAGILNEISYQDWRYHGRIIPA